MNVKLLSRGDGKTTIAIRESAHRQIPIVCYDSNEIKYVQRLAVILKAIIPQPIRFDDFLKNHPDFPEAIIDNLDVCFARLMPHTKIVMITLNNVKEATKLGAEK